MACMVPDVATAVQALLHHDSALTRINFYTAFYRRMGCRDPGDVSADLVGPTRVFAARCLAEVHGHSRQARAAALEGRRAAYGAGVRRVLSGMRTNPYRESRDPLMEMYRQQASAAWNDALATFVAVRSNMPGSRLPREVWEVIYRAQM